MRITFEIEINDDEFTTDGWQDEVRDIVKTYFNPDSEVTVRVDDIPNDDTAVHFDSATNEFTPV